jgi:competence protein ComFC
MKGKLRVILERLMEVIAPVNCLACGRQGAVLCTTCVREAGMSVRQPSLGELPPGTRLAGVSVGAGYEGVVKELVLQLKFHRLRAATEAAAALVLRTASDWPCIDVVTSVPVAAERYRERGYNQSELLAREVARRSGLPYRPLLGRTTSVHQMGLNRHDRLERVAGAFFALRPATGQRVLLVDDVVTTGATLSECAAVLDAAGASSVWGAAVARH